MYLTDEYTPVDMAVTELLRRQALKSINVGFPHYWKWWCEEVYEDVDWSHFSEKISILQMKRFIECT